jgi:predicted flap endonuclease-1-like 5' DNA nuclease
MVSNVEIFATVKSPSKSSHRRRAKGFSLEEIRQSGRGLTQLNEINIDIDYFRKSVYQENIQVLKSLKIADKARDKKKPFTPKERKRTPFKPKEDKPKAKPRKVIDKTPKELVVKEKPKTIKKEKVKSVKAEKIKIEEKGTPLTELPGLGAATAKKFIEIGINTIEDLCNENPDEIAHLLKGVSVDRCKNWIEDGKEITK